MWVAALNAATVQEPNEIPSPVYLSSVPGRQREGECVCVCMCVCRGGWVGGGLYPAASPIIPREKMLGGERKEERDVKK